jgi:hypothetical protein
MWELGADGREMAPPCGTRNPADGARTLERELLGARTSVRGAAEDWGGRRGAEDVCRLTGAEVDGDVERVCTRSRDTWLETRDERFAGRDVELPSGLTAGCEPRPVDGVRTRGAD